MLGEFTKAEGCSAKEAMEVIIEEVPVDRLMTIIGSIHTVLEFIDSARRQAPVGKE